MKWKALLFVAVFLLVVTSVFFNTSINALATFRNSFITSSGFGELSLETNDSLTGGGDPLPGGGIPK